jgi:hypothetical protein
VREKRLAGSLFRAPASRYYTPRGLFFLVPVLAQTLLALVGGNFMTLSFFTAGHLEKS